MVCAAAISGWIGVVPAGASSDYPSVIERDSPFAYWQLAEAPGAQTALDPAATAIMAATLHASCSVRQVRFRTTPPPLPSLEWGRGAI